MLAHLSPEKFIELIADFRSVDRFDFKCTNPTIVLFRDHDHLDSKGFRDVYDTLKQDFHTLQTFEVINSEDPQIAVAYGIDTIPSTLFISPDKKYKIISGFLSKQQVVNELNNLI